MTCFWNGILGQLSSDDYELFKQKKIPKTPHELCSYLKQHNIKTINIMWNDEDITNNQVNENFEAISQYVFSDDGYFCSTFDPFLFLISELFKVNIVHDTCHAMITYKCQNSRKVFYFASNKGHFWQTNKQPHRIKNNKKRNKKK